MLLLWIFLIAMLMILLGSLGFYFYAFYHKPGTEKDILPVSDQEKKLLLKRAEELRALPCMRVSITAEDGTLLSARLFDAAEGAPMVIACHGYKGDCDFSFACVLPWYREMGFRVLMIDERAHRQSGGHTITLGVKEKTDIAGWVRYMRQRFGVSSPITLWGISMGGNSVLGAAALCPELSCVVADCPFTTTEAIFRKMIAEKCKPLEEPLLWLVKLSARLWGGFSLMGGDALAAVRDTRIPILIIHGEEDTFVPYAMGKELYDACGGRKEFLSVPNAKHARSAAVHPELYERCLKAFLRSCCNR